MATQKPSISPLRQRMIEDMQIRKFGEKTESQNLRASLPSTSVAILTLPASRTCATTSCISSTTVSSRPH